MAINKTIYSCMNDSTVFDTDGLAYPDLLTANLSNFTTGSNTVYCTMDERFIDRFDLMMYFYYNVSQYDDLILFYNQKYRNDLVVGDVLKLPIRYEIDSFMVANKRKQ